MQNKVLQLVKGEGLKILTDTESLFSSFLISDNNLLHSIDTMKAIDRFVNNKNSRVAFIGLKKKDVEMYDFLIISQYNKKIIELTNFQLIHKGKFNHIYSKR